MTERYIFFRPAKDEKADELRQRLMDNGIAFEEIPCDREFIQTSYPVTPVNMRGSQHGYFTTPQEIESFASQCKVPGV